jgi:hypothetical protein
LGPLGQLDSPLATIDSRRDAFDVQVDANETGFDFANLSSRGIVQLPLVMPKQYRLEFMVERIDGNGSFGMGFSAGDGRMIALLDHHVGEQAQSGLFFKDPSSGSKVHDASLGAILLRDTPIKIRLDVSPERVDMWRIDQAADVEPQHVSGWHLEEVEPPETPSTPDLSAGVDAYYPRAFFIHVYQGVFRVQDFRFSHAITDPTKQPFLGAAGSRERRLAERIVWRGGHVEIITNAGTDKVHALEKLTQEPWIVGVEKCGGSSRLMIDDADLRQLATIRAIRNLDLSDTSVSSEGLGVLSALPSLSTLALPRRGINENVVAKLRNLPQLRDLRFNNVPLGDDQAAELARFPLLNRLCLTGTELTDKGVQTVIDSLPELRHLCLSSTKITGTCLPHLSRLTELEDLQLDHTSIDDAAIAKLPELPRLKLLTLTGSRVSAEATEQLRRDRPGLKVE